VTNKLKKQVKLSDPPL